MEPRAVDQETGGGERMPAFKRALRGFLRLVAVNLSIFGEKVLKCQQKQGVLQNTGFFNSIH